MSNLIYILIAILLSDTVLFLFVLDNWFIKWRVNFIIFRHVKIRELIIWIMCVVRQFN